MEEKKKTVVNQSRNKSMYLLLGLNLSLIIAWLSFNYLDKPLKVVDSTVELKEKKNYAADYFPTFLVAEQKIKIEKIKEPQLEENIDDVILKEISKPKEENKTEDTNINQTQKVGVPVTQKTGDNLFDLPAGIEHRQIDKPRAIEIKRLNKPVTPRDVTEMAIYPSCEKYRPYKKAKTKEIKKKALIQCFSKEMSKDVNYFLDKEKLLDAEGLLKAKFSFIIDKEGNLVDVTIKKGSEEKLGIEGKKALEKLSQHLKRNKKIKPAKWDDQKPVNLKISLPLSYQTQ